MDLTDLISVPAGRPPTRRYGMTTGAAPTAVIHRDRSLVSRVTSLHIVLIGQLTTPTASKDKEDEHHMSSMYHTAV